MEELIAEYSDALPYAIVPNGNGETNPGTPFGNNPSGSPLGPITTNKQRVEGSFEITNWTFYLSQAFGAGVHPSFPGSVTRLYPFSFASVVEGRTVINAFNQKKGNCGGFGRIRTGTGRIKQVERDGFSAKMSTGE